MCGRFTLTADAGEVAEAFEVSGPLPPLARRYNIAPTQVVAVVGMKPDGVQRGLALLRWGLVPHWEQTAKPKHLLINVRAESVRWKFGYQLRERRCVVPADGFYEWGGRKTATRFTVDGGRPFGLAGLWDVWQGEGKKLVTCCLVTTAANEVVKPHHDRMPVILPAESYGEWLDTQRRKRRRAVAIDARAGRQPAGSSHAPGRVLQGWTWCGGRPGPPGTRDPGPSVRDGGRTVASSATADRLGALRLYIGDGQQGKEGEHTLSDRPDSPSPTEMLAVWGSSPTWAGRKRLVYCGVRVVGPINATTHVPSLRGVRCEPVFESC